MPTRRRFCWRTIAMHAADGERRDGLTWWHAGPAAITMTSSASTPCGPSPSVLAMNKYGRMAIRHWQTFLPDRLRAIPESDQTRFFTELGEQAAAEIEELQMQLAGPDPVGEGLSGEGRAVERRADAGRGEGAGRADPAR